ncbi:baeRF2 domain-containing protein [Sinomonas humi]|uniref:Uncharacterized protein n=1 Tax=Sinomonas humi TaxID=1338436 RepID=A0A0B2ANI3_9MICC|nr:Vms1/Ankzf1 family peptidyl-tRNA hydrolase [Sinomonas humi]KHL03502.1 hypothetical protein LK10_08700 [Sinomonas humi]
MHALRDFAEALRENGPWCTIHANVSTGTVTSLEATEVLGDNLARQLADAGASPEDAKAAGQLVWSAKGAAGPVSRFVLIRDGEAVVDEVLPGAPTQPVVECGAIPNLLPLAAVRGSDLEYLVVEVERAEAKIGRYRASARGPLDQQEMTGETENLRKVPVGGWSQGKYQHRTEEIWRRNGADVAAEINRIVEEGDVQLVVISGDERARQMVLDALSERAAALAQTVDMNSSAAGADRERFEEEVDAVVAGVAARRQHEILERLVGGLGSVAAGDWTETLRALQQARVDTLLLSPEVAEGRTLLALGAEPWIATDESESLGAPVLGNVDASAALLRAAVLTKADTVLFPKGALENGEAAAALLRW